MIGPAEIEDMMNELNEARLREVNRGLSFIETASSRRLSWGYAPPERDDPVARAPSINIAKD